MDSIIAKSIGTIAKKLPGAKGLVRKAEPIMPYVRAAKCVLEKIRPNSKQASNLAACTAIYDDITE